MLLMIPGPVQLHERIIRAMARQMIGHRTADFSEVMSFCVDVLREVFQTKGDICLISGSGTAGMEAAIASFSNVRKMATIENGKFGERLGEIASRYTEVERLQFSWGESVDLDAVRNAFDNGCEAVAFVHNETSTGILNPAKEIASIAKEYDGLVIMDAITSAGGDYVRMDEWGVDVAIVGSQKCLGAPPGLAAVAVGEKAWEFYNERCPYYLDLAAYRKKLKDMQTPYTPAVPLFFALAEALEIIREEGLENRIQRHRILSSAVRKWAVEAGLELFPNLNEYSSYSNTVTAIKMPDGITDSELRGTLKKEYGILISGGQGELKGRIFRIGTMGNVGKMETITTLAALEDILRRKNIINPALEYAQILLRDLR
ncbi:pyridoxal-phosphate-dependent aminotransferase family protein [Archaeoglobus neptunius]|uniref:pyridoxal-phosphate-dependent aminotransferase family protein n=1 Tax=Archaeoglobus neptunius TaxID=2798580 RepID=UPI0019276338|nr:alanine--glyoxylate aminotransferase family protein [Archaeoglobus neptunius]